MTYAARLGDTIQGITTGEHGGHYVDGAPVHSPCVLSGTISGGASKVRIQGKSAARVGDPTNETDCCTPGTGSISNGSSKVRIQGKPAARMGDAIAPHNGTASITGGSTKVRIGG